MDNATDEDSVLAFMQPCPNTVVCLIEVTVVIAVTFLTLTGNVGNLTILLSTPRLRNCHGYLLISLSIADLITGLMASLAIYPSATLQASTDSWPYGDTACLIVAYITQVGITNSGLNLTLLSLERYVAVVHPLRYSRLVTKKVTLICIGAAWLLSASILATIFAGFPEHSYIPTVYLCLPMLLGNSFFGWLLLVTILAPIAIILVTSCMVSRKLKPRAGSNAIGTPCATANNPGFRTNIKDKTFRMVQVMTATFVLCYLPFFTIFFVSVLAYVFVPQVVIFGTFWLLLANSFFNTVIYFAMNTTYRKRMDELLDFVVAIVLLNLSNADKSESQSARFNTVDSNKRDIDQGTPSTTCINANSQDSVI